jgi:hypothetical protein
MAKGPEIEQLEFNTLVVNVYISLVYTVHKVLMQ